MYTSTANQGYIPAYVIVGGYYMEGIGRLERKPIDKIEKRSISNDDIDKRSITIDDTETRPISNDDIDKRPISIDDGEMKWHEVEAFKWYELAAKEGSAEAQSNLGIG